MRTIQFHTHRAVSGTGRRDLRLLSHVPLPDVASLHRIGWDIGMESIARDVKSLGSDECRLYESVVGHARQENQRDIIRVVELEGEADQAARRAAMGRAVAIAREGREAAKSQGITTEEADAAIDEAIRESLRARRAKP
jgi:hypothetical protein